MNRLDTDSATVVGLWIGVASFFIGVAGIGLTLYSFYKGTPDLLTLTASGWVAATLTAIVMGMLGKRLVVLIASLTKEVGDLNFRLAEALNEKNRLITVSEYLASKAIRTTTRKQEDFPKDISSAKEIK
jgi:hypothetical protein